MEVRQTASDGSSRRRSHKGGCNDRNEWPLTRWVRVFCSNPKLAEQDSGYKVIRNQAHTLVIESNSNYYFRRTL